MTRAKEITKEAKKFAKEIDDWEIAEDVQDAFEQGAEWADAHPDIDVRTMAAWQSGYNEGIAKSHWISVEDGLPKEEGWILICSYRDVDMWYYDGQTAKDLMDYASITHWMPLPAPPKGGEE